MDKEIIMINDVDITNCECVTNENGIYGCNDTLSGSCSRENCQKFRLFKELQRLQKENEELKNELINGGGTLTDRIRAEVFTDLQNENDRYKQALKNVYKIALSSLDCGEWIGQGDDKVEQIIHIINEVLKDE